MSKFKFSTANTAMLGGIRVSAAIHRRIKEIATEKQVTIQEVTRVFIEAALEEYEKETPHEQSQRHQQSPSRHPRTV